MKKFRLFIRERLSANIRFAALLAIWATLALLGILAITAYTIRLDIAFLEANKMMRDEILRDAIFVEVFKVDTWLLVAFPVGILANAVIAALFGRSQENYFLRFSEAFQEFSRTWKRPSLDGLGPLQDAAADFMLLTEGKLMYGDSDVKSYRDIRQTILAKWPVRPKIYWQDQVRFAVLSGALALYFSSLSMVLFWTANDNILNLSRTLLRATGGEAPQFFSTQFELAGTLGWAVVIGITFLSISTGIRFAETTSNASYAVRRQLRLFLMGYTTQRIFLRVGDPGREYMAEVNSVLEKIEARLKDEAKDAGKGAA